MIEFQKEILFISNKVESTLCNSVSCTDTSIEDLIWLGTDFFRESYKTSRIEHLYTPSNIVAYVIVRIVNLFNQKKIIHLKSESDLYGFKYYISCAEGLVNFDHFNFQR